MWRDRLGFGFICAATVVTFAWVITLITSSSSTDRKPSAADHPMSSAQGRPSSGSSGAGPSEREDKGSRVGSVPRGAQEVTIAKHTDGDTLHVVALANGTALAVGVDTTVRLLEIDTPESVDPNSPEQCFAERASKRLAQLLPVGSHAWVLPDQDLLDPYDRTLLYMWSDSGTFVNLTMVEEGQAQAVLYEPNDRFIGEMRAAERRARNAAVGLWGACDYFGQPVGFVTQPSPSKVPSTGPSNDPRFDFCYEANDAGYGNYVAGRDPEYAWYEDRDGDGRVCEF